MPDLKEVIERLEDKSAGLRTAAQIEAMIVTGLSELLVAWDSSPRGQVTEHHQRLAMERASSIGNERRFRKEADDLDAAILALKPLLEKNDG